MEPSSSIIYLLRDIRKVLVLLCYILIWRGALARERLNEELGNTKNSFQG